ncbi:nicotinamide riboside transporter PnuC [Trinickia caryophylli]|uniref:Nicotinamide riboside transporter PnuC n=1 Tax=Trinickia caryophylli TaxID=28094 RepID=A0A1X7CE01_TRICW|nr:nicotinamide riboside transporter PnuC [Trinickia caryophylli]PMS12573.1 nicotinamide riboside transporter PnuC [Trinickia caryophylli]TRX19778.1 nicotinamide mononucleotide transporter [Trinickia caryophylli]WQE12896.1 nicotinamide riboside transporter PnuC [Trinickia caryophylli]SME95049.1 nicotinamide mononucleotide transporter [Trinickia caryophylli]GLU30622.1 aminotransferase [Trinickia caryophylli]
MSVIEIAGVAASALAIWLTARRRMSCWPVGLLSVALYAWIFFAAKLYSDMLLQGAFAALQFYGWQRWFAQRRVRGEHAEEGRGEVAPARDVGFAALLPGLLAAAVGSAALGAAMARWTDASLPFVDATLTAFSLVGQYWTARRYIASWVLWIVVDVVYVAMFVFKGLYPTAALYAGFVVLAAVGWRDWRRASAAAAREPLPAAAVTLRDGGR